MAITLGHKLDASTLALWRLDEASGAAPFAEAVGSYPFTSASNSSAVAGLIADGGRAKFVNGAENHAPADSAASIAIRAGSSWTVECWLNVDAGQAAAIAGIVLFQFSARTSMSFEIDLAGGNNRFRMRWQTGGSDTIVSAPIGSISKGVRYHLAARKTQPVGGTACDLFLNGVKITSGTGLTDTNVDGAGEFTLGGAGVAYLSGTIDDVRISKVARTDAEISESYWRGLIDISQIKPVPFQQGASTAWQSWYQQIDPTELQQPNGAAFQMAVASLKDHLAERRRLAIKAKLPGIAPTDALAQIGIERGIPQAPGEADTIFAARLLNAWNTWPWAGTPFGLLQAFYSTGYRNVVLAQVRGGKQFTLDNGAANRLLWAQDFANASGWSTFSAALTANATTAPDGTTTATLFNEGVVVGAQHFLRSVSTVPTEVLGELRLYSVHVKAGTLPNIQIRRPYGNNTGINFNLSTGVIDSLAGLTSSIVASGVQTLSGGWYRPWFVVQVPAGDIAGDTSDVLVAGCPDGTYAVSYTGTSRTFSVWGAQVESGVTSPGPYARTFASSKATALPAGSLLTSTMASGLWETDPLSKYSPVDQAFWSKFDVLFPLPLMPPSWGWAGGIPSSSSAEANFIRALVQQWKPAHATCGRIIIVTKGNVWGYPASQVWGASTGTWGDSTNTVWTP